MWDETLPAQVRADARDAARRGRPHAPERVPGPGGAAPREPERHAPASPRAATRRHEGALKLRTPWHVILGGSLGPCTCGDGEIVWMPGARSRRLVCSSLRHPMKGVVLGVAA